jgi:symplekin
MVEQAKIPTLYMRTVLGSVKLYPSLAGFVGKVLQRLISKKIWNNPTLWEGFIRCCSVCFLK